MPTVDHSIHFAKISRKLPREVVHARLKPVADMIVKINDQPVVMVIDDWMFTGRTKELITHALADLSGNRITTHFGLLRGSGKNTTGDRLSICNAKWRDRDELVGVIYPPGSSKAVPFHTQDAIQFRKQMRESIMAFAQAAHAL